ncbi:MAG: divergent polysaccharide deacetylase family protein [Deltaproteobacteria bacterium]|nr:divergent polysaccharide deacetylase family protein [Deltaproteobacteria bacterium]
MTEIKAAMNRRQFICKTAAFSIGSLLGLNSFSRSSACYASANEPEISLIIDDIGFSSSRLDMFLELEMVMTFAVLPRLPMSLLLAEEIHSLGYEIMLHQPMEPTDTDVDPGPGAVFVGDEGDMIASILEENLSEFPYAVGINNHMGSRFTQCRREMTDVISVLKDKGLFFVDSLTSNRSTGDCIAKSLDVASARRNIFLDNVLEAPVIMKQLEKLKKCAISNGSAIGIGHPFPETAKAIRAFKNDLADSGVRMVKMSEMISG